MVVVTDIYFREDTTKDKFATTIKDMVNKEILMEWKSRVLANIIIPPWSTYFVTINQTYPCLVVKYVIKCQSAS